MFRITVSSKARRSQNVGRCLNPFRLLVLVSVVDSDGGWEKEHASHSAWASIVSMLSICLCNRLLAICVLCSLCDTAGAIMRITLVHNASFLVSLCLSAIPALRATCKVVSTTALAAPVALPTPFVFCVPTLPLTCIVCGPWIIFSKRINWACRYR